jgi:hypothetical protein
MKLTATSETWVVVQFLNPQEVAVGCGLCETVRMPRRDLKIVKSAGGTTLMGICEYCNRTFKVAADEMGAASKTEVRAQFDVHKCEPIDASPGTEEIIA